MKLTQSTYETFQQTNSLRWIVKDGDKINKILQQAWQGDNGTVRWKDIEEVDISDE